MVFVALAVLQPAHGRGVGAVNFHTAVEDVVALGAFGQDGRGGIHINKVG